MKHKEKISDRKELRDFFKKGSLPSQSDFEKLIDSTFNKADDKLDIDEEDGLMIYPSGNEKEKLISFFEDIDHSESTWALSISKTEKGGIYITKKSKSKQESDSQEEKEKDEPPTLFLQKEGGKVGLGTDLPEQKLDVRGLIASEGRVGIYEKTMDADGEWHNVFKENFDDCRAFEIMAYARGKVGSGKYSLMHAIAVSTFGNSKPKITETVAHYGNRWNKIAIRWESRKSKLKEKPANKKDKAFDISRWYKNIKAIFEKRETFNYNLQLKTKSNYGPEAKIYIKVSVLWDSRFI